MKKWVHVVFVVFMATTLAAGVSAGVTNTGMGSVGPQGHHVLSQQQLLQSGVLYAPSEDDDPVFRAAIAAITGGAVDYFDARAGTPDLATLQGYHCVYTWANAAFADNVLFGDRLANFVDGGGSVVLGAFSAYTSGNYLSGAIMGPGYSPVTGGMNHFSTSAYAGDGTTAIHAGVAAYDSYFRDILTLQGSGLQDGSYVDGEIAHAYRPDFRVIYSNGLGVEGLQGTGDWPLLIANACFAAAPAPEVEAIPATRTLGLLILLAVLAGAGVLVLRRL